MRRLLALCMTWVLLAMAAEPLSFPLPEAMMDKTRWIPNSSGIMSIRYVEAEKALRFEVEFSVDVDKWIYPKFILHDGETLNGATALLLDLKVESQEGFRGVPSVNLLLDGSAYSPVPSTGEWHPVRLDLSKKKNLATSTMFSLGTNPKNEHQVFYYRNLRFEGQPTKTRLAPAIGTPMPGTVCFDSASPVFTCTCEIPGLKYAVQDWHGRRILAGDWPEEGRQTLVLSPLPTGYYLLKASAPGVTLPDFSFTVVVAPSRRRYPEPDSFFAIDVGGVPQHGYFLCPWYNGDCGRLARELMAWAGFTHQRGRLSWAATNPNPGQFDFGHYLAFAKACEQKGMVISDVFHDAPAWSGKREKLPRDLAGVYRFCQAGGRAFGNSVGNWEYWNEQDIGFAPESAWDYAATLKAAYLGFKSARPDTLVTMGAFCVEPNSPYVGTAFMNDAAKFSDFLNYHTYTFLRSYPSYHQGLHQLLERIGRPDWAIWVTECSTNVEGDSTLDSIRKGMKKHSPEQELMVAEFYPKSQIGHMMGGVTRNYFFMLAPYNERGGAKDWGTLRRDGTVKPVYAAMATMTAQLSQAKLLGEKRLGDKLKGYLFERPDKSQVLVYWAVSNVDVQNNNNLRIDSEHVTTFSLPLADGDYAGVDLLGLPMKVQSKDGLASLTATRYPAYLCDLKGLEADVSPHPKGREIPYVPKDDEDLTVIVQADLDKKDFILANQKASADMPNDTGKLTLRFWNLSDVPKQGTLQIRGGKLTPLPESIVLPPMGYADVEALYEPETDSRTCETILEVTGVFNGRKSSRFAMPVKQTGRFFRNCRRTTLDMTKTDAWQRNTSATTYSCTYDEAEKAVRFDVVWSDPVTDRWFYPEHRLKLPEEDLSNAYVLEFEVKATQDKVENDFRHSSLMAVYGKIESPGLTVGNLKYPAPLSSWEKRRVAFPSGSNLKDIKLIRIGGNPVVMKLTYWVRNFQLYSTPTE